MTGRRLPAEELAAVRADPELTVKLLGLELVREVAAGLDALDVATLRGRFDPAAMAADGVYPDYLADGMTAFDSYLAPHFAALREFYRAAAANGAAVLVVVS